MTGNGSLRLQPHLSVTDILMSSTVHGQSAVRLALAAKETHIYAFGVQLPVGAQTGLQANVIGATEAALLQRHICETDSL